MNDWTIDDWRLIILATTGTERSADEWSRVRELIRQHRGCLPLCSTTEWASGYCDALAAWKLGMQVR